MSQNGTRMQNGVSRTATTRVNTSVSNPVTPCSAMIGIPRPPKATGAVLASKASPAACTGLKPRPSRMVPQTATGVPKPAAPSKKAPRQNAIRSNCSRLSSVMSVMHCCSRTNRPAFTVR